MLIISVKVLFKGSKGEVEVREGWSFPKTRSFWTHYITTKS